METTKNCETSSTSDMYSESGTEKFKEIIKKNNIQDPVSEVIIKESGLKGENLASLTSCVTIKFENPLLAPIHLFVKRQPDNQAHSAMVTESKLFKKEAMFFMEYFPEVQKFCKNLGQENLMDIYPKCYYGDENLIVLENLILTKGYMLFKKETMQDYDTAVLSLTNLAKHHAMSYCYIKNMGGPQQFFERYPDFNFLGFDTEGLKAVLLSFVENPVGISIDILTKYLTIDQPFTKQIIRPTVLSKSNQVGKEKAIEVLKKYQGRAFEKFMEPLRRKFDDDADTILVLNHGDFWSSNMMFLKDKVDGEKFNGHVMIDFQLLNFSTPAVDIGYYLFSSVKTAVRQAKLQELLEVYREVLLKTSKDLGYPIQMGYDELLRDFRATFLHGFLIGLSLCTGIAYAVIGDADPTDIDMVEFASVYNKLVAKWIEDNPEKNEENAKILISYVEEHERLKLA